MMKVVKQLKKSSKIAARIATIAPDDEYAKGMSNLSKAYRLQATLIKQTQKSKKKKDK